MADSIQLQQLLSNIQAQLQTVSSIAGQMGQQSQVPGVGLGLGPNVDLQAAIRAAVAAEMQKRVPPTPTMGFVSPVPNQVQSPLFQGQGSPNQTQQFQQPAAIPNSPTQQQIGQSQSGGAQQGAIPMGMAPQQQQMPQASQNQQQGAQLPQAMAPQTQGQQQTEQPSMQDLMMRDFLNKLRLSIGGALTGEQQMWISANLFSLPDFFKTQEGRDTLTVVMKKYEEYVNEQNSANVNLPI